MKATNHVCPNCGQTSVKYRGSNEVATDSDPLPGTVVMGSRSSVLHFPCKKCGSSTDVVYCCDHCLQFLCRRCVEPTPQQVSHRKGDMVFIIVALIVVFILVKAIREIILK